MNVTQVGAGASLTAAGGTTGVDQSRDQFLELLVTQIKNQNPLDPMDNAEFTSQLSQLASLEQLQQMNQQLQQSAAYTQSLNNTMLLSVVGRHATVQGDGLRVADGTATGNAVQLSAPATVTVHVRDAQGAEVASYTRRLDAGWQDITWDGTLADGSAAPDGDYTLAVTATDQAGNDVPFQLYRTGLVESIRFENNLAVFSIGGQDYYASEIARIGM